MKAMDGQAQPPAELVMEMLSREYGWTPSQIRNERLTDIRTYLDIISARNQLIKKKDV
jgi:hypothetical protein